MHSGEDSCRGKEEIQWNEREEVKQAQRGSEQEMSGQAK